MTEVKRLFNTEERAKIIHAIRLAEMNTSGEIRLHLEDKCEGDAFEKGLEIFKKLKMYETQDRNGVLIYLAVKDRKMAIIADEGINQKVSKDFWNHIFNEMTNYFKEYELLKGILWGIEAAGVQLKSFFPYQTNDKNELSDEISMG